MNIKKVFMILNDSNVDWVNPLTVILTCVITTGIALYIANKNYKEQKKLLDVQLKEQKRQWLYKGFIEREAEILIKFRSLLYSIEEDVLFFNQILQPYKIYGKMFSEQNVHPKDEDLIIKFSAYAKHYNKINELNNFYNENQLILKKNKIGDEIIYFTAILSTVCHLNCTDDFNYGLISENDKSIVYRLNIIQKIGTVFINSIDLEKADSFNNIDLSYSEDKLTNYLNEFLSKYFALKLKLDELTTFFEGDIPNDLKCRKIKYFPNI